MRKTEEINRRMTFFEEHLDHFCKGLDCMKNISEHSLQVLSCGELQNKDLDFSRYIELIFHRVHDADLDFKDMLSNVKNLLDTCRNILDV